MQATLFLILSLISSNFAQDSFSSQLQDAVDFCGGLTELINGNCPPEPPTNARIERRFKGAQNIKLCTKKDVPGLPNTLETWKNPVSLKFVGLNAHYNSSLGRYGFGSGSFLMVINFTAPEDTPYLAGRVVGLLPELPRKETFEKDICNEFLKNPCNSVGNGESRCPVTKGSLVNFRATNPFSGNYKRGLPVDLRVELFNSKTPANSCVTKDNLETYGDPIICFLIPGYII